MLNQYRILSMNVKGGEVVMILSNLKKLQKLIFENNGLITTKLVEQKGIHREYLRMLVERGELFAIERGVYIASFAWEDEMFILQAKYGKGVFSMGTALFLHKLTDRTPLFFTMTFPSTYNLTNPKIDGIRCVSQISKFYNIGITTAKTPFGKEVKCYDKEKTICDCIKYRKEIDITIMTDAIKMYANSPDKNLIRLMEYAENMGVGDDIRKYMEVLI